MIPFVNLKAQYQRIKPEVLAAMGEVLDTSAFIQGEFAARFEREFVAAQGAAHGIGCSNGTAAIALALEALGIGAGMEVITVPNTFIATVEAIFQVGARPVFVDVDPLTQEIDPALIEAAITPRTRAIMPVHLFGNVCDMDPIMALAAKHDLKVVEDAAQAHLATYKGRGAGTIGDAGTFSFYPGKNLGAYGDAGFVTVRDPVVAARVRKLADHGRDTKYEHSLIGYNQRMDGLQAAVLSVKLKYLAQWTEARRQRAARYRQLISAPGVTCAQPTAGADPVYHLFVVEVGNREEVLRHLQAQGIAAGIHYPVPLHRQPALVAQGYGGSYPVTERLAGRIMSLPICAEISDAEQDLVVREFNRVARG